MREPFDPLNRDHLRDLSYRIKDLSILAQACGYNCVAFQSVEPMAELREELKLLAVHIDLAVGDLLKRMDALEAARENRLEQIERAKRSALVAKVETTAIGEFFDPEGYFVYILWGDDEQHPVYVGKSTNILSRLGAHLGNRSKRRATRRIQLIRCTSQHAMDKTEALLIVHYRPQLNIVGNGASLVGSL